MKLARFVGVVAVLSFFVSEAPISTSLADASTSSEFTPSKLISMSLPATLGDCNATQATNGGRAYTNLWSVRLSVIDVVSEKVFTNRLGYTVKNPRISIGVDHSFHNLIGATLRTNRTFIWQRVTKFLKLAPPRPKVKRGQTELAGLKSIPPGHSIVLYATSHVDVSQGFFSNVTKGCNLAGIFSPWATTAVIATPPTYATAIVATSSLLDGKFVSKGAMSLTELSSIVSATDGSNTGPLPTSFGFPKIQGELLRNDALIHLTRGGTGTVFVGWAKDELPQSNTRDPFTDFESRAGNW